MTRYPAGQSFPARTRLLHALQRTAVGALVWWLLTEGDAEAWSVGIPLVLVVALASLYWSPVMAGQLRAAGLARFAGAFLYWSVLGGLDVARRAVSPSLPLRPAVVEFTTTLPAGTQRWLLVTVVSLMPGSLTVAFHDGNLVTHWLDGDADSEQVLRQIERRVAGVFDSSGQAPGQARDKTNLEQEESA